MTDQLGGRGEPPPVSKAVRTLLLLVKYDRTIASSRIRWIDHGGSLEAIAEHVEARPLATHAVRAKGTNRKRHAMRRFVSIQQVPRIVVNLVGRMIAVVRTQCGDTIVVQKYAVWPLEHLLIRRAASRGVGVLFDLDDAEYVVSPRRGRNLERIVHVADACIGGNEQLCEWMRRSGSRLTFHCPTPVEAIEERLELPRASARILWTGSPTSSASLGIVAGPLDEARQVIPDLRFLVLGCNTADDYPEWWEVEEWSAEREREALAECSVGLMPLIDTPLNRGKCAYKALLYAGHGVRVIASPVGVNRALLRSGLGLSASTHAEWKYAIVSAVEGSRCRTDGYARKTALDLVASRYSVERYWTDIAEICGRVAYLERHGKCQ